MSLIYPSASYVDNIPKDACKIKRTAQGTSVSGMTDAINHQIEYRFLRTTTMMFQESLVVSGMRFNEPAVGIETGLVRLTTSPRATQLWVWVDCAGGFATWSSKTTNPYVGIDLVDPTTFAVLDAGYSHRSIDGTLTEQYAGFRDNGLWDQRYLFSGDRTDPGNGAPRRLEIPEAYRGQEVTVRVVRSAMRLRSVTVMEAFQPTTEQ